MVRGDTRARTGLSFFALLASAIVWVSAVIVMGIVAYLVSRGWGGDHIIYELVIVSAGVLGQSPCLVACGRMAHMKWRQSVLTTAFYPIAFFLAVFPGHILMFNLVFSYLWIVVVSFTASDWTQSHDSLLLTVEAFSFIAL